MRHVSVRPDYWYSEHAVTAQSVAFWHLCFGRLVSADITGSDLVLCGLLYGILLCDT